MAQKGVFRTLSVSLKSSVVRLKLTLVITPEKTRFLSF
jgi:hypothetical protein